MPPEQSPTPENEFDKFIPISDVAGELGMQSQYVYYRLVGMAGYPNLGEGIRFHEAMPGNYHSVTIHPDDDAEFIRRVKASQEQ